MAAILRTSWPQNSVNTPSSTTSPALTGTRGSICTTWMPRIATRLWTSWKGSSTSRRPVTDATSDGATRLLGGCVWPGSTTIQSSSAPIVTRLGVWLSASSSARSPPPSSPRGSFRGPSTARSNATGAPIAARAVASRRSRPACKHSATRSRRRARPAPRRRRGSGSRRSRSARPRSWRGRRNGSARTRCACINRDRLPCRYRISSQGRRRTSRRRRRSRWRARPRPARRWTWRPCAQGRWPRSASTSGRAGTSGTSSRPDTTMRAWGRARSTRACSTTCPTRRRARRCTTRRTAASCPSTSSASTRGVAACSRTTSSGPTTGRRRRARKARMRPPRSFRGGFTAAGLAAALCIGHGKRVKSTHGIGGNRRALDIRQTRRRRRRHRQDERRAAQRIRAIISDQQTIDLDDQTRKVAWRRWEDFLEYALILRRASSEMRGRGRGWMGANAAELFLAHALSSPQPLSSWLLSPPNSLAVCAESTFASNLLQFSQSHRLDASSINCLTMRT